MKNLSLLFNDVTILNLPFILRLFRRYFYIFFIFPPLLGFLSYRFYITQFMVYNARTSFKYLVPSTGAPTRAIASLLGEETGQIQPSEVVGIGLSSDFAQALAEEIYNHPKFHLFNFNPIGSKQWKTPAETLAYCNGEKKCIIDHIRGHLPGFYSIVADVDIDNKYNVSVTTLNHFTTQELVRMIRVHFIKYRVRTLRHMVTEQIEMTEKLVEDRKKALEQIDYAKIVERMQLLEFEAERVMKQLELYSEILEQKRIELSSSKITLKYTIKTLKNRSSEQAKKDWEKYQNLKLKEKLLLADITSLENSPGVLNGADNEVLAQLKNNLKGISAKIKKLSQSRSIANQEMFKMERGKSKDMVAFQSKVLKEQLEGIELKYDELNKRKEKILYELGDIKITSLKHKPTFEYLTMLEKKLMQLRLMKSTVVADFVFDKYLSGQRKFLRHGLFTIVPFAGMISLLFCFGFIVFCYTFSSTVHDKTELMANLHGIPLIGEAPSFIKVPVAKKSILQRLLFWRRQ